MAKKHESKLKKQGIVEIVDLGKAEHKPNVCKVIVDKLEVYKTLLKERIKLGEYLFFTEPNVGRPTQCFTCHKFGHISNQCTENNTCFKCGSTEHDGENCHEELKCINCGENHHSRSGKCREIITRKNIEIDKTKVKLGLTVYKNVETGYDRHETRSKSRFEEEIEEIKKSVINTMKYIAEPINENMVIISDNLNVLQEGIKRVDERVRIIENIEEKKIDDTANLLINILIDYHNKYHDKGQSSGTNAAIKGIVNKHITKISDIDKLDKHKNKRRSMGELFNSSLKKLSLKK